jgi:hypothetical protein
MSEQPSTISAGAAFGARPLLYPSTLVLLAANLLPLAGVLFWGWDAFVLLVLYWMETAAIGFWTIARIATAPRGSLGEFDVNGARKTILPIVLIAFFILLPSLSCTPACSCWCTSSFFGSCSRETGRGRSMGRATSL